jgi:hypothetical protein
MTDEIPGMDELIPISHVRFVWPETISCTNDHFNDGLRRGDNHSIKVKTFFIDEPILDLEDWTKKHFGAKSSSADAPEKTFKSYKSKSVCCFLLMEMAVHQSETSHADQKKKKDKEAERKAAQEEMKRKADKAKARRTKRSSTPAKTPDVHGSS